jgi:hypothetical protein
VLPVPCWVVGRPLDKVSDADAAQALVEELLRTGLVLTDLLASLLEEIPEHAFPGEDSGAVLIEMVVGSCRPAIAAAGEQECRAATALIGAIKDRVLDDLRAASGLAGRDH